MDHLSHAAKIYSEGRENAIFCGFNSSLTNVDVLVAVFFATLFRNIGSIGGSSSLLCDPKTWNDKKKKIKIYLDFSFLL